MKTTRIYTLLALLMIAGGVTMQAQEQRDAERPTGLFECQTAQNTTPVKQPAVVAVEDAWLHYGSDVYGGNLAYVPEGVPFSWAVSFPPSVLQSYDGFTLTRVAIYENEWNMGNLRMGVFYGNNYMPLTLKNEQIFVPTGYVGLCEIVLDNAVEIDPSQHLWIVFSELDMTETYSAAFCYDDNPDPNARWVQMEENKWDDLANFGLWETIQFMIWAYVTDDPWGVQTQLNPIGSSAYPNPGGNMLNICTTLPNARVEVYDMIGRHVHSQEITENFISINAEGWPAGAYVWKVYTSPSTGSGTLMETGKWIKE